MAGFGFPFSGTSASSSSCFSFSFSNPSSTPSVGFGFAMPSSATSSPFGDSFATAASTASSPFGVSPLFGSSSSGAAPTSGLFGSSSGTAPTSNKFASSFPVSNLFGSGSSTAANLFGSTSGGARTSGLFGSTASTPAPSSPSPSTSAFGTPSVFGSPAPGSSNLFGSGAPTPSLFGASSATTAASSASQAQSGNIFSSAGCCSNSSANHPRVGLGGSEGEETSERFTTPTDLMAELIQSVVPVGVEHENEKGDATMKNENVVHEVSACSVDTTAGTVAEEMTSLTAQAHCSTSAIASGMEACSPAEALKYEATPVAENQSLKVVVHGSSENLSSESEVSDKNELGHPVHGSFMFLEVPLCTNIKQMNLSLQNTLSPREGHLIERILKKYGDITKGSILKSIEAKTFFLKLVAEVVEQLHGHTIGTIGAHDMQIIQKWTDDAAAVGFDVGWLQQRIKKVVASSKYQNYLIRLNEISEKINAANIALWEMELKHLILKKEMDFMKGDMDREDFCRSNLCEGLL